MILQKQSTNQPYIVPDDAKHSMSSWYQLGLQMALPAILASQEPTNRSASPARHVENKSIQAGTDGANTVMKRAGNQPTANEKRI